MPHDVWVDGDVNRNRAYSRDLVAVRLLPSSTWRRRTGPSKEAMPCNPHAAAGEEETQQELLRFAQDGSLQAQAVVVAILESRHQEFQIGALVPANGAETVQA